MPEDPVEPLPVDSANPMYLAVAAALDAETNMGEWFSRDLARRLAPRISRLLA